MITRRNLLKTTAAAGARLPATLASPCRAHIAQARRDQARLCRARRPGPLAAFAEADNFIIDGFARPPRGRGGRLSRSSSRTASPTPTAPPKSPRS